MLYYWYIKQTLETTDGAIKTDNIGYTRRKTNKTKTQHNMT